MVASQLQRFRDETDFLDSFQSSFQPGLWTETALVILIDDLGRDLDRRSAPSGKILLDLSVVLNTNNHKYPSVASGRIGIRRSSLGVAPLLPL